MKNGVLEIRPTQFSLGMKEVAYKCERIAKLNEKELDDYIDDHVVPIVQAPENKIYMIDNHHYVAACWRSGIKKVKTKILADFSQSTFPIFWEKMAERSWLYLYDQFGNGPHEPAQLPLDITGLADDLFRSLAWELRRTGILAKDQAPFSEFKWANFLRASMKSDTHRVTYEMAVEEACLLAKAAIASGKATEKVAPV